MARMGRVARGRARAVMVKRLDGVALQRDAAWCGAAMAEPSA